MIVELLVTLKGKQVWKKGTLFDTGKSPLPQDIRDELSVKAPTLRVLVPAAEAKAAAEQRDAEQPKPPAIGPEEDDKIQCELCDTWVKPKGMHFHMMKKHPELKANGQKDFG